VTSARWVAAAVLLAGCGGDAPDETPEAPALVDLRPVAVPAGAGSGEPNLAVGSDALWLSWLEPSEGGHHALRIARWNGDGWGDPMTVLDRPDLFVNWADFPSLSALEDGTLLAHWLEKSGPGTYAYDVRTAISGDGGASWSEDIIPHRDGVEAEHGFVSVLPMGDRFGLTWLDGRETIDGDPMTVRFATITPDGELGDEALLDASACDCCQTALASTAAGPIAVYRDRTEDEVRDIHITRRIDGEWTEGVPVHRDGWVIPGCPVNGPAVAAVGERVAVAWFTGTPVGAEADREAVRGAGERGRALVAFSGDGGATFGAPVRVDDGGAMGRVDVELLDDGAALVTWLERVEGAAEVRVRRATPEGPGPATPVTGTAAERASGFPRSARLGGIVVFAWTEPGEAGGVRTAVARIAEAGGGPGSGGAP
jgi:hypothetical protein